MDIEAVLGLELSAAQARLAEAGYSVRAEELRAKRAALDGEKRVLRARLMEDGAVSLCYALFQTELPPEAGTE